MNRTRRFPLALGGIATLALLSGAPLVVAAPSPYTIDPEHTYPSFEASHMGISIWRGKFDKTTGTVTLDQTAGGGVVDIVVDLNSVDFGHAKLNAFMVGPEFFDAQNPPRPVITALSRGS